MSLLKNLQKSIKTHHVLAIIGLVVAIYAVMQYSNNKSKMPSEGLAGGEYSSNNNTMMGVPATMDGDLNEQYGPATELTTTSVGLPPSCAKAATITDPADLLPADENNAWAELNPAGEHDFKNVNLLKAGYHTGINTQGQSLRNANYQLRSEPPNPTNQVSPWMQATIEPDNNRKPLEIGGDY